MASIAAFSCCVASGIGEGDIGGGGSDNDFGPSISHAELIEASRFASQSTFGMTYEGIEEIATAGRNSWLEQQFDTPPSFLKPIAGRSGYASGCWGMGGVRREPLPSAQRHSSICLVATHDDCA